MPLALHTACAHAAGTGLPKRGMICGVMKPDAGTVPDVVQKQHGVRFPDPLWAEIERAAAKAEVSASDWVRTACELRLLLDKAADIRSSPQASDPASSDA